jgi:hypothetical protein
VGKEFLVAPLAAEDDGAVPFVEAELVVDEGLRVREEVVSPEGDGGFARRIDVRNLLSLPDRHPASEKP